MLVYVLKQNGQPFMPTERFGKVRRLLKEGKAKVVRREPFTIRLLYEPETDVVQECYCGVDTGSKHIGVAVVGNDKVLYQSQTELRDDIKRKMDARRQARRFRRSRKTRYRKPRFLNRRASIREDRLPPSVKHKVQAHIDEIEFCKKILPISDLILEVSQFDTALMKNPNLINEKIRYWGYQQGFNYGYSSRRSAILHRDNYTCQCCGKKNCRLEVHHIKFRRDGGTDDDGNVTHVFRQYTTKWVDDSGKELKDMITDKDTKEHGTIQDYAYVNSETDNNGNVKHIFRQYTTKWVDEDNKELKTPVTTDSVKEHGDIPEYAYVTTNTDEKGNVTHIFRQYTTEWVDEDGKELKDIVKGASPMPRGDEIKDYKFVESKTDEKGNVKHIFKQFITRWVNTELEDLDDAVKTSEFKDAKTFENYQFVETREVGNTRTHIYRRYNTFWVEEKTNKELKKENKLVKEPGDITSYVYVRTETKENGDLVHIYKKVEQKKNDVPTGVKSNILLTGITLILSALGITILNKKKREA